LLIISSVPVHSKIKSNPFGDNDLILSSKTDFEVSIISE